MLGIVFPKKDDWEITFPEKTIDDWKIVLPKKDHWEIVLPKKDDWEIVLPKKDGLPEICRKTYLTSKWRTIITRRMVHLLDFISESNPISVGPWMNPAWNL